MCVVDNVFMQVQNESTMGQPFTHRSHFMPELCKKLGITPFGLHALRHKSVAIVYGANGLQDAQRLLDRCRARPRPAVA